jgi:tellurite resistance protein
MAYLPISPLFLAGALIPPRFPEYVLFGYALTIPSLLIQVIIAWRVVHLLSMGNIPTDQVTPVLHLPIVPRDLLDVRP